MFTYKVYTLEYIEAELIDSFFSFVNPFHNKAH